MSTETLSQKRVILQHLKRFGSIEPLTALQEYGCYRLSSRISDLRNDGYNIITDTISSVSKITGRPIHFANYRLLNDGSI